jgi:hypothetical protein
MAAKTTEVTEALQKAQKHEGENVQLLEKQVKEAK